MTGLDLVEASISVAERSLAEARAQLAQLRARAQMGDGQDARRTTDAVMSTEEAATYLGRSAQTLRVMRRRGRGPAFLQPEGKRGRVEYLQSDLDAWRREKRPRHTNGGR